MKLPGVERAVIDSAKVRDYLLSPSHPVGRFKARFFVALGYDQENWEALLSDLQRQARVGDVAEGESSAYGQKFLVRGTLASPSGRSAEVVAIWIIRTGEDFPRFVTAFPA